MRAKLVGTLTILVPLGLWAYSFVLADRWMEHLRIVNDDRWGYSEIGTLPLLVPAGIGVVVFLVWFWLEGIGPLGKIVIEWFAKE